MDQLSYEIPAGTRSPKVFFGTSDRIALGLLLILAIVLGVLSYLYNPLMRNAAAIEGAMIDQVFAVAMGIATAIFTLVQGALLYVVLRYRRRHGDLGEGWPIRHFLPAEILWTAIPIVIVTSLSIYSYQILVGMGSPSHHEAGAPVAVSMAEAMTIEVRGRQFAWEFRYPDEGVTSNTLHVPLGQPVRLVMRSLDVVHAFWVPDFRVKRDLLPDRDTELIFTATRLGTFPVVCSRICGVGHAYMRSVVTVEQLADFEAWLAKQPHAQAQTATGDPIDFGRQLFKRYGCGGCHTLEDVGATGQAGPTLNGIGMQAANRVSGETAEQYIHESILDPAAYLVPGYSDVMPHTYPQQITAEELSALAQYLLAQH